MPWPPKFIDMTGAELEGGWLTEPQKKATYHHDGSVIVRAPVSGEFISAPMKPEELLEWVVDPEIYPAYVNPTCGLHVHMSFKSNLDYGRLMTNEFHHAFLVAMKILGRDLELPPRDPYWQRLEGSNRYCRKNFNPGRQWTVAQKNDARYTILNYCWGLHGTIECRLFPMFKSRTMAGKAIKELFTFTDGWLLKDHKKKPAREKIEIPILDEPEIEILDPPTARRTSRPQVRYDAADDSWISTPIPQGGTVTMTSGGAGGGVGNIFVIPEPESDSDDSDDDY